MGPYDSEPTIATQLTVEMLTNDGWQSHPARIANLTRQELWVALDQRLAEPLDPGRAVRLVLSHPKRPAQTAETVVLWHIGRSGNVVVLKRPGLWDPPSRRENMRVKLAVPVYLDEHDGSGPMPTTSIDIGVGGLFCVAAMSLRIGQRVAVAIQLTPDRTFECQAEVARLDDDPNDPMGLDLLVGLRFLDLTRQDQASLAEAISGLARGLDAGSFPGPWQDEGPAQAEGPWQPEEADLQIHVDIDGPSDEDGDGGGDDDDDGASVPVEDDEYPGTTGERLISIDLDERHG